METSSTDATAQASTAAFACPWCRGPVDFRSRHVAVAGSSVRIYCSEVCLQAFLSGAALSDLTPPPLEEEASSLWPRLIGISIGLGALVLLRGPAIEVVEVLPVPPAMASPVVAPLAPPEPSADVLAEEARREAEAKAEAALVAELAKDAWVHPLAGPERQMPRNHTQAFGAERPGDRPAQCISGHCGVDLGGGLWGEPVHAAHAGVVDRVNRGPNEEHGGVYVRISHREGTVFTWYFHLAAVPRWIQPGTLVEAGQVIGLVGDTGIKTSAPHLHFAMTVKSPDAFEHYLDPEPLIAIWPLWIPAEDGTGLARVSTHGPPGVPVRTRAQRKVKAAPPPAEDLPIVPVAAEAAPDGAAPTTH